MSLWAHSHASNLQQSITNTVNPYPANVENIVSSYQCFPNGIKQVGQETWPACGRSVLVYTQTQIYYTGYRPH